MNVRHSLVNLIALLALAGCSQAPTPGATPAATKSPTLKAQDLVQTKMPVGTVGSPTFVAGGSTTIRYYIQPTNGDGAKDCNVSMSNPATLTIKVEPAGTPTTALTPSTSTLTFTACKDGPNDNAQAVTFSSLTPGTYDISATISGGQGTFTLQNTTYTIVVTSASDTEKPVITKVGPTTGPVAGSDGWYGAPVTYAFKAEDDVAFPLPLTNPYTFTRTTAAGAEGGSVTVASGPVTDAADNTADEITSDAVKIDLSPPTNIAFSGMTSGATYAFGAVPAAPTCSAEDALSGVQNCVVTGYSSSIGRHTLTATATDKVGHSATKTLDYTVADQTPPTLNVSDDQTVEATSPDGASVTFIATATDNVDANPTVTCKIGGTVITSPHVFPLGTTTVSCMATDATGNSGAASFKVNVQDTTAPTIAATADHSGWFNGDVTVSFTCTENGSGLVGGCPAPVVVSAEGTTPVSASVTDRAGNTATSNVVNVQIDKTAPVASVQATTAPVNGWYRTDVAFTVTGTDAGGSGVASCTAPATLTTDATGYRAQGTCTDNAGNVSEVAQSVAVNRDTVAPTLTVTPNGTPSAFGWYRTDVTFTVAGNDERSGVSSCTQPATLSTEQAGYQAKATCTDNAGNTSAEVSSVAVNLDKTAPTFTRVVTPGPNADGWNNTDVTLDYTCADTLSGLDGACPADSTLTASADVAALTVADQAGNTASLAALSVQIDKVKPTITAVSDRAANSAGWYAAPVTVSFTCNDDLSGVKTCAGPSTVGQTDADGQTVTGTAADKAGNTESASLTVKVDTTVPTISAATFDVNGNPISANANGWFNQKVVVKFTCADALSGVSTCPAPVTVGETALGGQTVTGSASDQAGNSASTRLNVKVDLTAPTATITPTPATPNGLNGWYTTQSVTLATSGTDNLTAVTCTPIPAITASTPGTTVQTTCTDLAGNTATASLTVKFDRDAPTLTLPGTITATATGNSQASVPFTVSASDNFTTPQPVTCRVGTTPVTSPAVFPVGTTTVTCAATDNAGNTSTGFFTVSVKYDFRGFFQPVDMNGLNTAKAGSAIPVKFSLGGNQGLNVMAAGYPKVYAISCSTLANLMPDEIETTVTAGGSSLTYDATAGQYVYVWKTSAGWAGTCQRLVVQLADGTQKEAVFKFR